MRQQLVPTLRAGAVVVMNNLSVHKVAGVRAAIEAVDAGLDYLPPYSPDFNPIEQAFAELKWLVHSAKERTVDDPLKLLTGPVERFSLTECRDYFRKSGYATRCEKMF